MNSRLILLFALLFFVFPLRADISWSGCGGSAPSPSTLCSARADYYNVSDGRLGFSYSSNVSVTGYDGNGLPNSVSCNMTRVTNSSGSLSAFTACVISRRSEISCPSGSTPDVLAGVCSWPPCSNPLMHQDSRTGACSWADCPTPGMVQDSKTGACSWPACPEGQARNPLTNTCESICSTDQVFDSATGSCHYPTCPSGQVDLSPDLPGNQCGPPPTCSAGFKLNDAGNLCVADGSACVVSGPNATCPSSTGKPSCSPGFIPDPAGGPGCVAGNGSACVATPSMGCPDTGAGTTGGTGSGTGSGTGTGSGSGDSGTGTGAGTGSGSGGSGSGSGTGSGSGGGDCPFGTYWNGAQCAVGAAGPDNCVAGTSFVDGVCKVNFGGDGGVGSGSGTGSSSGAGGSGSGSGSGAGGSGSGSGSGGSDSGAGSGSGAGGDCPSECALGQSANCFANDCPSPQVDIDPVSPGPQCGPSSQRSSSCGGGTGTGTGAGAGTGTGASGGDNSVPTDYARENTLSNGVSNIAGKLSDIKTVLDGISRSVVDGAGSAPAAWSSSSRSPPAAPNRSSRVSELQTQISDKISAIRVDVGTVFAASMPASAYVCNRQFTVFDATYKVCFDDYLDSFQAIGNGIILMAWIFVFMVILR